VTDPGLHALDTDAAVEEAGRLLFARPCEFLLGVAGLDQLPSPALPEIAFAGRSNVGKSSLINALTGRTALARTSNTPGRTQEINFFELDRSLRLVDLPGYGFARAPKSRVDAWTGLVFDYLRGRPTLALVCLLLDARHELKVNDLATMRELGKAAVPFLAVLTKADLVNQAELHARTEAIAADLKGRTAALRQPIPTSARTRRGIPELRAFLATYARPASNETAP
jgi:GTP-binding protein